MRRENAETAHLKVIALGGGRHGAANLISNAVEPETTQRADCRLDRFQLILNARVGCDPTTLRKLIETEWQAAAAARQATVEVMHLQCFRP